MFNWFKSKSKENWIPPLTTDVHSHLLPGIDDGVKTIAEAEEVILRLMELGYTRFITTPHIHELYRNTPDRISTALELVKKHLSEKNINISIQAAAEYNLDDWLMKEIEAKAPLLTFNKNYLLFETNFLSEPLVLNDFIFKASTLGYKLILAHPERYMYLLNNTKRIEDLLSRGVLFQLNLLTLSGMYGPGAEKLARFLIDQKHIHLVGSDCHNSIHVQTLRKAMKSRYFTKALDLPLLNYSL